MRKQFVLLTTSLMACVIAFGQVTSTDGTFSASGTTNLALRTNTTARLTILGSGTNIGFVGINTTAPSDRLHINSGNVRANQFNATTGIFNTIGATNLSLNANNTVRMTVLSTNGFVGINTTAPADMLHVVGSARANQFNATTGIFNTIGATNLSINANNTVRMTVLNTNGFVGINTITPADMLHAVGSARANQFNSTTGIFNTIGATTNLALNTNDVTRMTVLAANGNVGIGTASPAFTLDVGGSINATSFLLNGAAFTGSQWTTSASNIYYNVAGSVGIGTTTPSASYKLDVNGAINATGLNLNGTAITSSQWTTSGSNIYFNTSGNVGIGSLSPNQKLTVNGTIYGKEVKVDLNVPGPDYVFDKDYALPSLDEISAYIEINKHLPEVPSAIEMEKNGINLSEMNMLLLKKIEELTLHVLKVNERLKCLEKENEALRNK